MVWLSKKIQSPVFGIVGIIAALLLIVFLGFRIYWFVLERAEWKERVDPTTYQAVFLESDQIYFGKLKDIESKYPILEDVYYVKLEDERAVSGRLVKLGIYEPHGPRDQMILNRDHILFWENLKTDSAIIQTIRNLKLNQ